MTILLYLAAAVLFAFVIAGACWVWAFHQMLQFFESLEEQR